MKKKHPMAPLCHNETYSNTPNCGIAARKKGVEFGTTPSQQTERTMAAPREVRLVSVHNLKPNKRNVRTHSKKQIAEIAELIRRFGWTYQLLVDENGCIIAGHGRYQAALLLNHSHVPIIVVEGLSEVEKRALAIADNKVALNAGWDRAALAAELGELAVLLPECQLDLDITGFEPADVDTLLGDWVDPEHDPADDVAELATEAVTRRGDFWQLGSHGLLCGDAREADDLAKLMGRERAAMVFTDLPYNDRVSSIQGRGKIRHREFVAGAGEMSRAQFTKFLADSLSLAADHSRDGSIHYVCMGWRHMGELQAAGEQVFGGLKNLVVWMKTTAGQGTFYRSQHELIFVYKHGDAPHINNFELGQHGRHRSNVWTYAGANTFRAGRMAELALHPTVKPVAMVADAMRDCSRRGDIVLDSFMGSGTTIMAAERVGRRGYGLELDPLYVDAAVRRWQGYTKRDATLKATGETFDEIVMTRSAAQSRGRK